MTERKIKQTYNYFLKHRFTDSTSNFVRDCGLSFIPHELRIKSVSFESLPQVVAAQATYIDDSKVEQKIYGVLSMYSPQVYILHWEGVGDICSFKPVTERVADYAFELRNPISGQQQFQVRHTTGRAVDGLNIAQSDMVIHMEFIEYA